MVLHVPPRSGHGLPVGRPLPDEGGEPRAARRAARRPHRCRPVAARDAREQKAGGSHARAAGHISHRDRRRRGRGPAGRQLVDHLPEVESQCRQAVVPGRRHRVPDLLQLRSAPSPISAFAAPTRSPRLQEPAPPVRRPRHPDGPRHDAGSPQPAATRDDRVPAAGPDPSEHGPGASGTDVAGLPAGGRPRARQSGAGSSHDHRLQHCMDEGRRLRDARYRRRSPRAGHPHRGRRGGPRPRRRQHPVELSQAVHLVQGDTLPPHAWRRTRAQ